MADQSSYRNPLSIVADYWRRMSTQKPADNPEQQEESDEERKKREARERAAAARQPSQGQAAVANYFKDRGQQ